MTTSPDTYVPSVAGFEDLRLVGQGGSARVYSAYQPEFDRTVAVKVFDHVLGEEDEAEFLRELRAAGRIGDHPNIVPLYQTGLTTDQAPFVAMPLYRDGSLQDHIDRRGALSTEETLRVGVKLAGALATAHELGIIHADVKPHNVLFTSYRDPVLSDFGAASLPTDSPDRPLQLTPRYAAPERFETAEPTPAIDIYSLGLTLAVALGEPLSGDDSQSLAEIVTDVSRGLALSDRVEPPMRPVLETALDLVPEGRPSARDFAESLRTVQQELGYPATALVVAKAQSDAGPTGAAVRPDATVTRATPTSSDSERAERGGPVTSTDFDPALLQPATSASQAGNSATLPPPPPSPLASPAPPPPPPPPPPTAGADFGDPEKREPTRTEPSRDRGAHLARRLVERATTIAAWFASVARRVARSLDRRGSRDAISDLHPASEHGMASLLADRPTSTDLLGNGPLVDGLARVLNDPGTSLPLTLAVTGQWGSGKSSLMLQLESALVASDSSSKRDWIPVWFDVWRFQSRELLWAGLARSVYQHGVRAQGSSSARLRLRLNLLRRRHGIWKTAFAACALLGLTAWLFFLATTTLLESQWSLLAAGGVVLTSAATAVAFVTTLSDPFHRSLRASSFKKRYDDAFGLSDRAERDIDNLISALAGSKPNGAVVVFLDDLDRCEPETIRQALVTVSEVFGRHSGDAIVFVLGLDIDIVTSVVEAGLADVRESLASVNPERSGLLGGHFLEKVFQLQVGLESNRRPPTERLLDPASASGFDARQRDSFLDELRDLDVSKAADLTWSRRDAGLGTMVVEREDLPALRAAVRIRRSELLSGRAGDVGRAERAVLGVLRLTPRAVKRFDNTFRLQLQVAANTPGSELEYGIDELTSLAKWTALRLFYPRLSTAIAGSVGLWEQVETLSAAGDAERVRSTLAHLPIAASDLDGQFLDLLALGLPDASVRRLPLETFAGVV